MFNYQDLQTFIGYPVMAKIGKFEVLCQLLNYRVSYGRNDWELKPLCGGETTAWVSDDSITHYYPIKLETLAANGDTNISYRLGTPTTWADKLLEVTTS
jgi:hypothetical protein